MAKNPAAAARLIALMISCLALVGCDGRTSLRGTVSDASGTPIPGASVRMMSLKSGRTAETHTSADGAFAVGIIHGMFAGEFSVLVYKPGYLVFTKDLEANTRETSKVRLEVAPQDWQVVRAVPDEFGGIKHFVLIPEAKQRDRDYYSRIGGSLCEPKKQCSVNFWTDVNHIPYSAWMPVPDLAVMTGSFEWHPSYSEPSVHLACWLYPSKKIGESMKCSYEPGAKVPPDV